MLAETVTFDIGPGALALLTPVIGVVVLIIQNYIASKRTKVTATKAEEAAKELKPNGGTSLRDAVDRIEAKVDGLASRVGVLEHERELPPPPPPAAP